MLVLFKLIFGTVIDLLRSRATLEAEIVVLEAANQCAAACQSQETSIWGD
jgi:hypothetical protein